MPDEALTPGQLHAAMRYSVLGGGKRIRPLLVYATGETLGIPVERLDAAAAAVELIHAFSLVHDDLPAMDDDALRRGRATTHKAFGEAVAILVGDALQVLAFRVLAADRALSRYPAKQVAMVGILARATGSLGMTGGQCMDLAAEGRKLEQKDLEHMYFCKTGSLILASVRMAACAARSLDPRTSTALENFGRRIGVAFQIWDDVLDVTAGTADLGKTAGSDEASHKATWPSHFGLEQARARAHQMSREAVSSLAILGSRAEPLRWLCGLIVTRPT